MRSVGSHSTSEREKEGIKERTGYKMNGGPKKFLGFSVSLMYYWILRKESGILFSFCFSFIDII